MIIFLHRKQLWATLCGALEPDTKEEYICDNIQVRKYKKKMKGNGKQNSFHDGTTLQDHYGRIQIGIEEAKALGDMLKNNKTLEEFDLACKKKEHDNRKKGYLNDIFIG